VFRTALSSALVAAATVALVAQQAPPRPAAQVPDPQVPPITFRAEVNYVEVDAVVTDAAGKFVRDLKQGDFQVFEDGKPQSVSAFSLVDIPIERSERPLFLQRDVEPDVQTNLRGPEGRLYVLVLDDLHTHPTRTFAVRKAAKQFIERNLGANDLMAVVYASGRSDGAQDFTSNKRLLEEATQRFLGRKLPSPFINQATSYASGISNGPPDPDQQQRLFNARAVLGTLRQLSDFLASVHGRRKAVILLSEGSDFNTWATFGSPGSTLSVDEANRRSDATLLIEETQEVIGAATRANVNIYGIDPRGLADANADAIEISALPVAGDPSLGLTSLQDELRVSQDMLRQLSENTGGFASVSRNDFTETFQRIVDENSSYYVLGYYTTNDRRDGRLRKLDVRLTRPGLRVRARSGYMAPRGKPPADKAASGASKELRDAIDSPLQVNGLKMALFAAPLKGPAPKAVVGIVAQIVARDVTFTEKEGKFASALEMSYVALAKDGKVAAGNRETLNLALKPDTHQRVLQAGFRVQSRLELPPGAYQLRVAAREPGGKTGSVFYDIVVPDFSKDPLAVSGLFVTSATAALVPTAGSLPEVKTVLPGPPTTARTFAANDELAILAEIYDNQVKQPHTVYISTTLKAEGSKSVFSTDDQRSSKELGGAKGGFGYTSRVPLKGLEPGLYVLRVEAKTSIGNKTTVAARETQIRVIR
jgi:VWFA-related protein